MKTEIETPQRREKLPRTHKRTDTASVKVSSILVPVDFSNSSVKALKYAVALAGQFGARIVPIYVVELPDVLGMTQLMLDDDETQAALKSKLLKFARKTSVPPTMIDHPLVRRGRAYREIIDAAQTLHSDLIVISTHGYSGVNRMLLGSVTERVVREAPCPVLVVRENEHEFVGP